MHLFTNMQNTRWFTHGYIKHTFMKIARNMSLITHTNEFTNI